MSIRSIRFPHLRRFYTPVLLALFILFLLFSTKSFFPAAQPAWLSRLVPGFPRHRRPTSPPSTIPELKLLGLESSTGNSTSETEPQYCTERFGPSYLSNLRDHSIEYCGAAPEDHDRSSRLTCFHSHIRGKGKEDSLCIAQGAVLDLESKRFLLDCHPRSPTSEEKKRGLIPFERIRGYWYDTGPRFVFDHHVDFTDKPLEKIQHNDIAAKKLQRSPPISILIKREGSAHPWHSLMEIWALTHTMDILRLSANPEDLGAPFLYTPDDIERAQVVILDDADDGPFFDLWRITAGRKPVRLSAALDSLKHHRKPSPETALIAAPGQPHNVVVPLPGAANPLWQNDWEERNCSDASLVKLFIRRVLHHLDVEPFNPKAVAPPTSLLQKKLRVTFINRRGSRKLLGQEKLLEAARQTYPDVEVRSIDLATMSFVDQIRLVRHETDILLGVHGAGLTHVMFLRAAWEGFRGGKAIVEILPDVMNYKGFRNLAYMLGHGYFSAKAKTIPKKTPEREKDEIDEIMAAGDVDSITAAMKNGGDIDEQILRELEHERQLEAMRELEEEDRLLYKRGGHFVKRAEWQSANVRMEEGEFVELVGSAIEHVRNKV
ncbi:hypothetical protein PspLS_01844 [Pyricularia sp. CBS 133598]|nr:hypothetical protein PspLS_01844 [Pyricularia sp. CBS 133598]